MKVLLFYGLKTWKMLLTARQLSVQMLYNTILFIQECVAKVPQHTKFWPHASQKLDCGHVQGDIVLYKYLNAC